MRHGSKRLVNVTVFGYFWRPEMQKLVLEQNFIIVVFLEPECGKCAKSAKRATFEHLGSLLPPFPPARPGQLWETSGRRSPDVSQTSPRPVSASASAAGFLRQGVSEGEWEDAPPPLLSPQVGYLVYVCMYKQSNCVAASKACRGDSRSDTMLMSH